MANMKATWSKLKKRPDPLTSIALTIPVFLFYQLGILVVKSRSGLDLVSGPLLRMLETNTPVYVIGALTLALGLAIVTWVEEKRGVSTSVPLSKVLLEGFAFALIPLAVFGWATRGAMRPTDLATTHPHGVLDQMVLSAGTGLHQEFIFRALLVTVLSGLLALVFRVSKRVALGLAVGLSSISFALIHNWGVSGEPFAFDTAAYNVLLGAVFAGLYLQRGFAVAVYAHVFFELGVYLFRA